MFDEELWIGELCGAFESNGLRFHAMTAKKSAKSQFMIETGYKNCRETKFEMVEL